MFGGNFPPKGACIKHRVTILARRAVLTGYYRPALYSLIIMQRIQDDNNVNSVLSSLQLVSNMFLFYPIFMFLSKYKYKIQFLISRCMF